MSRKIAVIGLGNVGLKTAVAFAEKKVVIGFDTDQTRIEQLKNFTDHYHDFTKSELSQSKLKVTSSTKELEDCNFFIVIVQTPVKKNFTPDFSHLKKASAIVGKLLKKGDIVVYESTVYPGATEEVCVPILEKFSQLKYQEDFTIGYSPERINNSDLAHTFFNTPKIVSGSTPETLTIIKEEYQAILKTNVVPVSSIKVAEAAKILENTQRDINIALINEVTKLFHSLDIDTQEVINAAKTKWNFMPVQPGFVGGHCISVDPYYLIYQANALNSPIGLVSMAREINENMPKYVSEAVIKHLVKNHVVNKYTKIALLGVTYKEDYADLRNSKTFELGKDLTSYGLQVLYEDPIADKQQVEDTYNVTLTDWNELNNLSAIIITVSHQQYKNFKREDFIEKLLPKGLIADCKGIINKKDYTSSNVDVWRL